MLCYAINNLNGEETVDTFYEKESPYLPKENKTFRIKKIIKKKGENWCVK